MRRPSIRLLIGVSLITVATTLSACGGQSEAYKDGYQAGQQNPSPTNISTADPTDVCAYILLSAGVAPGDQDQWMAGCKQAIDDGN